MKKLICAGDVEAVASKGQKVMYCDKNTIITPSARDVARNCGIEFSAEAQVTEAKLPTATPSLDGGINSELIYNVLKALSEKGMLQDILASLNLQPAFSEERGVGGFKLVRGDSVRMDVLETSNPDAKVHYQELITDEDSAMHSGFLTIEKSNFDWTFEIEEVYYVIEGNLSLTMNGSTFVARPGDVLFMPAGAKAILGSPDKVKVFYTTSPAK